ncbi:MAG: zinc dependent phospholipase C family protein [Niastella sp.]|uniref:zinc dependent phospholipase C family protein n=1 Tax=Niastella sp. TaxID=1869183 RepID=UPI003899BB6D
MHASSVCKAYSVLTHQALIDVNWDKVLLPLLKEKFPGSSNEALKEAHAYVYGGAVVSDMGYYPFGSKLFTNLIHYVRSGDFVEAVLNDAHNLNEYAFALGVLCHYYADVYGHRIGINVSVPEIYPKLKRKFGDRVTFDENHISHLRTEFSFDVLQTARGNYASMAYHDFIGFKVADTLLRKAFTETYGLDANELFGNFSKAVGRFRFTIMNLFPFLTKAAWAAKKDEIQKMNATATSRNFIYRMHQKNDRYKFGKSERPGFFARAFALVIVVIPKLGPLKAVKFKDPGPVAEKNFIASFDTVTLHYAGNVMALHKHAVQLNNVDFDTGLRTSAGEYSLADKTYCDLLLELKRRNFEKVNPALKKNIISFYAVPQNTDPSKKRSKVMDALVQLILLNY